jgi:hypothetical protein
LSGVQFWLLHVVVVGSAAIVFLVVRGAVARVLTPAEEAAVLRNYSGWVPIRSITRGVDPWIRSVT